MDKKKCKIYEKEVSREAALEHLFYFCGRSVKVFYHAEGVDGTFCGILLYETRGKFSVSRGQGTPSVVEFYVDIVSDLNGEYITIDMR